MLAGAQGSIPDSELFPHHPHTDIAPTTALIHLVSRVNIKAKIITYLQLAVKVNLWFVELICQPKIAPNKI
jgi:hypothetical protein